MPTVVVTDYTFPDLAIERAILEPLGYKIVASKERPPAAELRRLVADADAVITQFAAVNADVIAAMKKAKAIVRYGIGVDNVDLAAARARKIPVCNVPDYCIDEVADHTLAFILALTRQVVPHTVLVRQGIWSLATPLEHMKTLRDLTVGILGFGRIGQEVAARLKPFKCRIFVHDPFVAAADIERVGCDAVRFGDLIAAADLITLHCPSNVQTRGLINRDAIGRMKPGVVLINLARGDLIESAALTEALANGHVAAAAMDVFAPEPIPAEHPILKMDRVVLAPHIASTSVRAVHKLRTTAASIAAQAVRGEPLPNIVSGV